MSHVPVVTYHTIAIAGSTIFYREAGPPDGPVVLLLHGWPASSHMFRDLMPQLADRFRLIAPDYPGFGFSEAPSPQQFAYTFDHLAEIVGAFVDALGITKASHYVQDYGGPIGFRLAAVRPELIRAIIVQNAVAHLVSAGSETRMQRRELGERPQWVRVRISRCEHRPKRIEDVAHRTCIDFSDALAETRFIDRPQLIQHDGCRSSSNSRCYAEAKRADRAGNRRDDHSFQAQIEFVR